MANKYVNIKYDKFSERNKAEMPKIEIYQDGNGFHVHFELHFSDKDGGFFWFNLSIWDLFGSEFFSLEKLILNINDSENIVLECSTHDRRNVEDGYIEEDYCEISKDILKRICEAKTIDVRVQGRRVYQDFNANRLIKYAQVFYNGICDESAYKDVLNESLYFTRPAVDDEESNSNSGGGCVDTLGGCVDTLLMFSAVVTCLIIVMSVL